jgi:hypothetical protein
MIRTLQPQLNSLVTDFDAATLGQELGIVSCTMPISFIGNLYLTNTGGAPNQATAYTRMLANINTYSTSITASSLVTLRCLSSVTRKSPAIVGAIPRDSTFEARRQGFNTLSNGVAKTVAGTLMLSTDAPLHE